MSLVSDEVELAEIRYDLNRLGPGDPLAIDTETTGVNLYTGDTIRGISLAYRDRSFYVPISHPDSDNAVPADIDKLIGALNNTAALPVFHNATFDWASLGQLGYRTPTRYYDTQVVSWLLNENGVHSLKGLSARIFGEDEKEEQNAIKALFRGELSGDVYKRLRAEGWPVQAARLEAKELAVASRKSWATLTAADIAAYAAKDAAQTKRLHAWQLAELVKGGDTDPSPDVQREFRVQQMIARMVARGVLVDEELIAKNRAASLARMWEIEPTFEGVNLNSPKQLAKLIYDDWGLECGHFTKTGARSTNREALDELEGAHGDLDALIEYRRLSKRVGTYYDNLLAGADSGGRVHTGFCTTCTVTGRLSSRNPNLMNLPREETDAEVKKVFRASPGMELWEFDLKSAELFVGASIAQDDDMLAALEEEGRDFHTETAMALFGSIEGNRRTLAKNMNYGIPYGIGPKKFAVYLVKGTGRAVSDRDIRQSRHLIDRHKMKWPMLHRGIDRLTAFANENHYVPLHKPGRFRHFRAPGLVVPGYTAFNAVVQGGVAELMKDVMLDIEEPAASLGALMVLQVHDSIAFEVPPGVAPALALLLQEVTDAVNPFRARLTWDAKLWPV